VAAAAPRKSARRCLGRYTHGGAVAGVGQCALVHQPADLRARDVEGGTLRLPARRATTTTATTRRTGPGRRTPPGAGGRGPRRTPLRRRGDESDGSRDDPRRRTRRAGVRRSQVPAATTAAVAGQGRAEGSRFAAETKRIADQQSEQDRGCGDEITSQAAQPPDPRCCLALSRDRENYGERLANDAFRGPPQVHGSPEA